MDFGNTEINLKIKHCPDKQNIPCDVASRMCIEHKFQQTKGGIKQFKIN